MNDDRPRRHIRVFLSAPMDVVSERNAARTLIKDALSVDPILRDQATFEVVSWDDPDATPAMPAHLTPQAAIDSGLPRPSDCDIVLVVLWSRFGRPLPPDYVKPTGERYLSGTEWEYDNAIEAARRTGRPSVLLYRRTEPPVAELSDSDAVLDEKRAQYRRVQQFFGRFENPDGSLAGSYHPYPIAADFRELLRQTLLHQLALLLKPAERLARASAGPVYQGRVESFLDEYLKSETGPVPFGGREREMADLDAWLDDASAPARCLVTAPAGRGKSALLVRWVERMRRHGRLAPEGRSEARGWSLVLVPISIRFGTNAPEVFYHALADRLAALAGQPLGKPITSAAGFYADTVRDLLGELGRSGRSVLVIVDGVDEALRGEFDPTVLPRVMPRTIRVVLSARWQMGDVDSCGWLDRLDWREAVRAKALDLGVLDRAAIAEVLVSMGAPLDIVAADPALVTRLHELTAGEPLLLRYYAADLWQMSEGATRITRADLDRMRPGFGAYFDRWLELQEKAWRDADEPVSLTDVDAVLMVLAFAHGPLEGGDIVTVTSHLRANAGAPAPHRLLAPLRRFVIGEGSREQGYVLSHPKIGEHLQQERFRHVGNNVRQAFLAWGHAAVAAANDNPGDAGSTPRYLVQFYRRHLQDSGAHPAELLALVQNGWRRAWESFEGSQEGFAADVRAAWEAIRAPGPMAQSGQQLRCGLVLASIRSLGHNVPKELVVAAVAHNVMSIRQARHLARFMGKRADYVATLGLLASRDATDANVRIDLLNEALAAAKAVGHERPRANALRALAGQLGGEQLGEALAAAKAFSDAYARASALSALGARLSGEQRDEVLGEALAAAKAVGFVRSRASVLRALAAHLSGEQRDAVLGAALAAAKAISDERSRANALRALAGQLRGEQLGEALAAAKAIGDERSRASALSALAAHLGGEQRDAVLGEALEAATAIDNEYSRASVLSALAGQLSGKQLGEALAAAKAIGDEDSRASVLRALAGQLSGKQLSEALAAAKAIGDEDSRASALRALAGQLSGEQRDAILGEALAAAKAVGDEDSRASALRALAGQLSGEQRDEVLGEALAAAKAIRDAENRASALGELAGQLSGEQRDGVLGEALAAAKAIGDEDSRASALSALAGQLSGEQLGEALAAAKAIGDEDNRASALSALAGQLSGEQRDAVLGEALAAAKAIGGEGDRASALLALADHSSGEQRAAVLAEALAAAKAIGDEGDRASALLALAEHASGEQRDAVLAEALATAKAIGFERFRASTLLALAAHVSGEQRDGVLGEALAAAKAVDDEDGRASALSDLAGQLSGEQLGEALAAAKAIGSQSARASVLSTLAGHSAGEQRAAVLGEALAAARAIGDEDNRASALLALAAHINEEQRAAVLGEALAAAKTIGDENARASALSALAGQLSREQLGEALAAAKAIGDEDDRASTLLALAADVSEEQRDAVLAEALAAAKAIGDEDSRASALLALAAHVSAEQRDDVLAEALAAAKTIDSGYVRGSALSALAGQLSRAQLGEALAAAKTIGDEESRASALSALAGQLSGEQHDDVLGEALAAAKAISDEDTRASTLSELAGQLREHERREAFAAFLETADRLTRPQFLRTLQGFMTAIAEIGGEPALQALRRAINETATWYP